MKNVKQKFSGCRRAAMLTVTAILLSCLPSGKALAWEVGNFFSNIKIETETATLTVGGRIIDAPGTNPNVTNAVATITSISIVFKSGANGHLILPASFTDAEDPEKSFVIGGYTIYGGTNTSVKTLTISEGVEGIGSLPTFSNATAINLPSTLNLGAFAHAALSKLQKLTSISVAAGNPYHSSKGDGILYDASGEIIQYIHSNVFKSSQTTLDIPEGVKGIANNLNTIVNYSQIKTINLPSTFDSEIPNIVRTNYNNLQNINVAAGNDTYYSEDGVVFKYETRGNALVCYPKGRTADSYTVLAGVTTIGQNAFSQSKFTSIDLNEVTSLMANSFVDCQNKITLNIPAGLTNIAEGAFSNTKIEKFVVDEDNQKYASDEVGVLFEKKTVEGTTVIVLKEFPQALLIESDETYTIPSYVSKIGTGAFKDASEFKGKLIISSGVKEIDENAFNKCKLNAVEFEEECQVKIIPQGCFKGCGNLKSIEIPLSIEDIRDEAFSSTGLTSVNIPSTVNKLGSGAFSSCGYLVSASFLNDDMESIPNQCFQNCWNLETVRFPENCTVIGNFAFQSCGLENPDFIPSSITHIGDYAFQYNKFPGINLPQGLLKIGNSAFQSGFYYNPSGYEITIPASVTYIEGYAFSECNVTKAKIADGSQIVSLYNVPFGTSVLEVVFEGSSVLREVGNQAFFGCTELQRFDFPNTVNYIGVEAFSGSMSLSEITFDKENSQLEKIDRNAFTYSALTDVEFPNSLKTLELEAFKHCEELTDVTLSALIQYVNGGCFNFCPMIENFYVEELPDDATQEERDARKYFAIGGYLLTSDKETLVAFPEAKANDKFTLLPPSIQNIGDYAFYCCEKLKNIVIPNKVTSINGIRAFGQCTNLNTITFLCDDFLNPEDINQNENEVAFDTDALKGKTVYVRKKLLSQYQDCDFYNVANIVPSFYVVGSEYINVSEDVVDFLSTTSTNHTFVVPETVRNEGGTDMKVELIGDYAFQNAPEDIREVVVFNNVTYVGGNAFVTKLKAETPGLANNESTIKRIYFVTNNPRNDDPAEHATELDKLLSKQLSTDRFELTEAYLVEGKDYGEFTPSQRIYVKKSMCKDYKKRWTDYAGQIDYKIKPGADDTTTSDSYDFVKVSSGKKYSTFSREFDVDLGEYAAEKGEDAGRFDIKAFTMGVLRGGAGREQDYPEGNGETPSSTYTADYHLKMYHIGYEDDLGSDKPEYRKGTYISNSTGVLLAVMNDWNGTPDDYFYCIGEDDNGGARNADAYIDEDGYVNGSLHRAVETTTVLPAIEPDADGVYHPTQWVLQGGVFRYVGNKTINLPPHKAWLYLNTLDMASSESQQGAISAPMMTFGFYLDDNSVATDIEAAEEEGRRTETDGIYTITGVKVVKPETKGIYIINGKKHVIR